MMQFKDERNYRLGYGEAESKRFSYAVGMCSVDDISVCTRQTFPAPAEC